MTRGPKRVILGLMLAAVAGVAGCPAPGGGTALAPVLRVFPAGFSFNDALSQDFFTISNGGGGTLTWTITTTTPWLSFSAASGSTTTSTPSIVTMFVDPTGLADGNYLGEFTVTSNGGTLEFPVALQVGQIAQVPVLQVSPLTLNYGNLDTVRSFLVRNAGVGSFDYSVMTAEPWITTISPSMGTVSNNDVLVVVTINRGMLPTGVYQGEITVSAGDAGSATVVANMSVGDAPSELQVQPTSLDFGTATTSRTFTITNNGGGSLNYTVVESETWLSVNPANGTLGSGVSNTITATVNRSALTPRSYSTAIQVSDGVETVNVSVTMEVADTGLVVRPTSLIFGQGFNQKIISLSNAGPGTINWSIDTAGLPPWLSISPTNGSVGATAQAVFVEVDRSLLPAGNFNTQFTVDGGAAGSQVVTVSVVVNIPVLQIESGILNQNTGLPLVNAIGQPLVDLGSTLSQSTFIVRNAGNGVLNWNIPPNLNEWLTISPISGSLGEGEQQTVSVMVDRNRPALAYTQLVPVSSSAGPGALEVAMLVPGRIIIGTDVQNINLGLFDNVSRFFVANFGDAGTRLNFRITSNRDWLFQSPATGISQGVATPPPNKDFRRVDISIDRAGLTGSGGTGTLTIVAIDESGQVINEIQPAIVNVSVEAAPLTFEQAEAQLRTPSIVRFTFSMRDIAYRSIGLLPEQIPSNAFQIFEEGVPLEVTETNQFLTNRYRTNLLIALDFSGSLFDAAQGLGLAGPDPLRTAYAQVINPFLDALPDDYNIGIMEFHDRGAPPRILQTYTQDKQAVKDALANVVISDHGSTDLFPASQAGITSLSRANGVFNQNQYAQVNALVMITDGRLTTPPGELQDVVDPAVNSRIRFFTIGWGRDITNQVLASLASQTGGHHFTTRGDADGEPLVSELDSKLQELAGDLQRQLVLTYITLNEESNQEVLVNASVDDPADMSGPLPGAFVQQLDFANVSGDTFLGQVSVEASPQTNGEIIARVRADYMPRNINKFRFVFSVDGACDPTNPGGITFQVRQASNDDDGLIGDWIPSGGNPVGAVSSGVFRYDALGGTPLRYGDFGDLVELVFPPGTPTPFTLCVEVDNSLYAVDIEPKYFTFPDSIRVRNQTAEAPSFPTPRVDTNPLTEDSEQTLVFGAMTNTVQMLIGNIGGSYDYPVGTDVELVYEIANAPTYLSFRLNGFTFDQRRIMSTLTPDLIDVTLDRSIAPGTYIDSFDVAWGSGSIANGGSVTVFITATVLNPVMFPAASVVNLGTVQTSGTFQVQNTGQSTLVWEVVESMLPDWASVNPAAGTTTTETDVVTVSVDRYLAPAGVQNFVFDVISDGGGTQTVTVQVTILAPTLTVNTNTLDFGTNSSSGTVQVTNTGQSTLAWSIDDSGLAPWLSLSVTEGTTRGETDVVGVTIDRTGLASGMHTDQFTITSNGGNQTITVEIEVP